MRRLILPDVHHKIVRAQRILDSIPHDSAVFLGDYWDEWGDIPADAFDTAQWLLKRMHEHPEDEFLLGNHDIPYLFGVGRNVHAGWGRVKEYAIHNAVGSVQSFRKRFKLYAWVDGWLLTHAGLSWGVPPSGEISRFRPEVAPLQLVVPLLQTAKGVICQLEAGNVHRMLDEDGITWCREFRPIPGVKQLFGHTARPFCVGYNEFNWCIDTHLNHYAIIEDGVLTLHNV